MTSLTQPQLVYQVLPIDQSSGSVIHSIWSLSSLTGGHLPPKDYTFTPHGCVELLVLLRGSLTKIRPYQATLLTGTPYVLGVLERSVRFTVQGCADLFGIRLAPGLARTVVQQSLDQFVNRLTPLNLINTNLANTLRTLRSVPTFKQRVEIVQQLFQPYQQQVTEQEKLVHRIIQRMTQLGGRGDIQRWLTHQSVHLRTIERLFVQEIGLSPKHYSRLMRLWQLLQTQVNQPWQKLTQLAVQAGFYDQSHFIKEFSYIVQDIPSQFFRTTEAITATLFQKKSNG